MGESGSARGDRIARGRTGEQAAALFLEARGYQIIAQNQRTPLGELDLVCRDHAVMVIVEVKSRCSEEFGSALEAIGPRKARRLRASALWWLSDRGLFPCCVRFDAVVISMDRSGCPLELEHFRDIMGGGER